MNENKINQTIQLEKGRTLGFAEYGANDGVPIFYFTGGNSSRLEGQWFEEAAKTKNVRLIVPDRPGFGLSDFQPGRQLLDWAKDIENLADALSIEKFSLFGLSGGGPHVLATLAKTSNRIFKAAVISGTAPPDMLNLYTGMWPPVRMIFLTAKYIPFLNRFLLKQMGSFYSNKDQMLKQMKRVMPQPDIELIEARPEIIDIFAQSATEAHLNGIQGDAWEWHLYVNPWGFQLNEIKKEIRLYYGLYDQQVPIEMGRFISKKIPNADLVEVKNGGHFSTINNHINEIFDYLSSSTSN